MYNVVIAEDERIIRDGLSRLVDWREFDCEVKFLAEDGLRALTYIQSNPVDILITDIKMPHMNGLELIRNAKNINDGLVAFVISGYEDFEYAKAAIQYNVAGYLMKPLEEEQLAELLEKATSILRQQAQQKAVEHDARKIRSKNLMMARERLFARTFFSRGQRDADPARLETLNLSGDMFYGVYLFEVTENLSETEKELLACISENIVLVEIRADLWAAAALDTEADRVDGHLAAFKSVLLKHRSRKNVLAVGAGVICQGLDGLRKSFEDAVVNLNLKRSNTFMLHGGDEKISGVDLKGKCEKIVGFVVQQRSGLPEYLRQVEEELLMTGPQCIENTNVLLGGAYAQIVNMLLSREGYVDADALIRLYGRYERAVNAVEVRRKIQLLEELLQEVSALFEVSAKGKWAKEINMAIAYIEKNYYNRDMDVGEIAEYVGMNPRYFSMIFKEKVGKNVMKYLIEYRVNIAKQFLMDKDLNAYQVAEMIGYDSYPYFSTLFRKVTGENPSTYAERMRATVKDVRP